MKTYLDANPSAEADNSTSGKGGILDEEIVPIAAVPKLLKTRPHLSSVVRWSTRGSHGVVLKTYLIGSKRVTTRKDLERFIVDVTAAAQNGRSNSAAAANGQPKPSRSAAERERSITAAERELADG